MLYIAAQQFVQRIRKLRTGEQVQERRSSPTRLLQAEGAVVYRDELVENLWSEVSVHSRRRLDGVVQRVRKRLYGTRLFIVSKYGKGYYLQYHKEENGSCFV